MRFCTDHPRKIGTLAGSSRVGDWENDLFSRYMTMTVETIFPMSEDARNPRKLCLAFVSSVMVASFHITIHVFSATKTGIESRSTQSNARCPKNHAGWSSKDWNSKSKWQRSAVRDAGQSSQDKWKSSKPRAQRKEISHSVEELETLVKEQKNTWAKSCKESSKRKTGINAMSEGMADDVKIEDSDKGRLRKALKQHRKDRDEENAARELLEEMQQNVDDAHARSSESERRLCQELEEFMYSWDREVGTPYNLSAKIWQMMRSNNTKSDNLESDFPEILERTQQLGWNETAKAIRVRADESP